MKRTTLLSALLDSIETMDGAITYIYLRDDEITVDASIHGDGSALTVHLTATEVPDADV